MALLSEKVLTTSGLSFPPDMEADLHPDFIDLCRRLIRLNPAERMPFGEFFNHKFLATSRESETISESHHALDLKDTCQAISSAVNKVKSETVDSEVFDSWEWIEASTLRSLVPFALHLLHCKVICVLGAEQ